MSFGERSRGKFLFGLSNWRLGNANTLFYLNDTHSVELKPVGVGYLNWRISYLTGQRASVIYLICF
jgi:hypothetical protein